MESPYTTHSVLPNVPKTRTKSYIPIRSITYKKNVSEAVEQENRQDVMRTLKDFFKENAKTSDYVLPKKGTKTLRSNPELSISTNPYMSCTFHQLNFGSPKIPKTTKGHSALFPNIKSTKMTGSQSVRSESLPANNKNFFRQQTKGLKEIPEVTAQEDYFKLLVDPNRQTFQVQEFEGVDEYYTNEFIMSKIHKHGFRDAKYYATKPTHVDMSVPDEATIRETFRFKIPPVMSSLENSSTLATHVLGGTWNNIEFVELAIESSKKEMQVIKEDKREVDRDVEVIKRRFEKEVKNIEVDFLKRFEKLQSVIKEDFVLNQSEMFKHQKEIIILKRDKIKIEEDIEALVPPLQKLDKVLYGQDMFDLVPNNDNLNMIKSMNIRPDVQVSLKYSQIIH